MNTNYSNFEHTCYVLNITFNIGHKTVGMSSYFLGRQHAGEGSHHSSRYGTNYVVQSSGVFFNRIDLVKFLYPAVDTIVDRI